MSILVLEEVRINIYHLPWKTISRDWFPTQRDSVAEGHDVAHKQLGASLPPIPNITQKQRTRKVAKLKFDQASYFRILENDSLIWVKHEIIFFTALTPEVSRGDHRLKADQTPLRQKNVLVN